MECSTVVAVLRGKTPSRSQLLKDRVAQTVSKTVSLVTTRKTDKRKRDYSELVQSIADLSGKTLVVVNWNIFQRYKGLLVERGGRYGTVPRSDGRTTHQVKFDHEYGVLTLEYVAAN